MAKGKKSVTVTQWLNPRFDSSKPPCVKSNPEYSYRVDRTINTLEVSIGQCLPPLELQKLIDRGLNVTVAATK